MSAERPRCWFCQQPIMGKAERHHVKPRRYFRKREDHRRGNIVNVHSDCHRTLHREYDNARWSWREFVEAMEPLKFGEGLFAGD